MEVFKFGGASVKDAASIRSIPHILGLHKGKNLVVVISAMGKTTNALEKITNSYFYKKDDLDSGINTLEKYHFDIINELFPDKTSGVFSEISHIFENIRDIVTKQASTNFDYEYDRIVSNGEIISSKILSHYLNFSGIANVWFEITDIIATDNEHRGASVNWTKTLENVENKLIPVTSNFKTIVVQGFIGKAENNNIVTLGREGSDYSASIIAYCINAESITIWKDVPGVLNADPKYFKKTIKIEKLSYLDAVELAYYGASVIHPKTIKPLENKSIPLFVRSFLNPESEGTIIHNQTAKHPVPMFIFKKEQILLSIYPTDFSFIAEENLSDIFSDFAQCKMSINLMQNTAISFSIVADYDPKKTEKLITILQKQFKVKYNTGLELITIRNYDQTTIDRITAGKEILLEQKTRSNVQLVVRQKA
jgi:aspartate kinase